MDNRPGAGASIGTDAVAKAAPDGYTIGLVDTGALVINPAIYPKLPYDSLRDFAPIMELATMPFMLVAHPSLGVSTVGELIAAAKREPGHINYASVGMEAPSRSPRNCSRSVLASISPTSPTRAARRHSLTSWRVRRQ